jgi:CubicO group peptidase (beta-lactamase class C family)
MHRGLFGLVVAAALEDGVLPSMQATLGTLVPDWFPPTDARSRIRVEDLLHGQSGLEDPPFANAADSPGMRLFVGSDLRTLALAQQPVQPAGERFRGAILDAQLLGLVLEERLRRGGRGGGYAAYLDARIWRPIGAGRATLRLDREGGATRTFCCLQASAPDWARVGQLVLDRGRAPAPRGVVLREASIARLLAPAPLNDAVGAFWFLKPTPLAPRSADPSRVLAQATPFAAPGVVYAGARGGQRVYAIPSRRAVVVRFGAMRYDFDDGAFLNPFLEALDAR